MKEKILKISELVEILESKKKEHGDIEVLIPDMEAAMFNGLSENTFIILSPNSPEKFLCLLPGGESIRPNMMTGIKEN